jgi:two-component system, NarL family, response regulator NreC
MGQLRGGGGVGNSLARNIRVLLVEDHHVIREGLKLLIDREPDLEVVGEASTLEEAAALQCEPDAIVADLVLPDGRTGAVVSALKERFPQSRVLALTMLDGAEDVRSALQAGAAGYLLKESAPDELVEAIRWVGAGRDYLHPLLGVGIIRIDNKPGEGERSGPLTPREEEVLGLLAKGHTNQSIAEILGISPRTVEVHRAHISDKLGTNRRDELTRYASESGLMQPETPAP